MTRTASAIVALAALIALLAASTAAGALTIKEAIVDDQLDMNLTVTESVWLHVKASNETELTLTLPKGAHDLAIADEPAAITDHAATIPLQDCSDCVVRASYIIDNTIEHGANDSSIFSRTLEFSSVPEELAYTARLPPGHILLSTDAQGGPAIVPAPTTISTDGKHIAVLWTEAHPTLPKRYYLVYTGDESIEGDVESLGRELSEWPTLALASITFVLGAALGVTLTEYHRRKFREKDLPYVPLSLLSPDEKKAVGVLRENARMMDQKEIGKALGWSKSKVSAIMSNLQYKEIIRREKKGRSFTVHLIKAIEA